MPEYDGPPIVRGDGYVGYYLSDIEQVLGKEKYEKFAKWISDQTVAIVGGEKVVYAWDYERFLDGLPVID